MTSGPRRRIACGALAGVLLLLVSGSPASADAVRDAQWHRAFLHLDQAQAISQGDGVIVAVVDTGVDATHPDLVGNVLPGIDLFAPGGDGRTDIDGHGSDMAGLIAAHGRGGAGALGVAPKAKILPVRVGDGVDIPSGPDAEGITWAVQHGAKVISVSLAGVDFVQLAQAVRMAQAADVLVVAAAGNRPEALSVTYPAAYPGVLAVGGVDRSGNHADVSVTGSQVQLAAPAVDIISSGLGDKYSKGTGTSDATAIVAGVAALVRAKYPTLSAVEVMHRLTATATDKGPAGRDSEYGYGIVDPVAALTADVPPLPDATSSTSAPAANVGPTIPTSAADPPGRASNHYTLSVLAVLCVGVLLLAATATGGLVWYRRSRS